MYFLGDFQIKFWWGGNEIAIFTYHTVLITMWKWSCTFPCWLGCWQFTIPPWLLTFYKLACNSILIRVSAKNANINYSGNFKYFGVENHLPGTKHSAEKKKHVLSYCVQDPSEGHPCQELAFVCLGNIFSHFWSLTSVQKFRDADTGHRTWQPTEINRFSGCVAAYVYQLLCVILCWVSVIKARSQILWLIIWGGKQIRPNWARKVRDMKMSTMSMSAPEITPFSIPADRILDFWGQFLEILGNSGYYHVPFRTMFWARTYTHALLENLKPQAKIIQT